jgi:chromosome partitioning protein
MIKVTVANQKGGTGKTSTALILATLLAERKRVLVIDLDPQSSLTFSLGYDPDELDKSIYDVFVAYSEKKRGEPDLGLNDVILTAELGNGKFDLVPSSPKLENFNVIYYPLMEKTLSKMLSKVNGYDVVLIDTQPTIGKVTMNGLVASDYILIPVEVAYLSITGLTLLFDTINNVIKELNPHVEVLGVLPVKFERRVIEMRENLERVKMFSELVKVYPPVPKSVAVERLISKKVSLSELSESLKTAKDVFDVYIVVARDILEKLGE